MVTRSVLGGTSAGRSAAGPVARAAADLAARQLRAIGVAPVEPSSAGFTVADDRGPPLLCEIGWAGPVALPLSGEAGVQAACGLMHVHGRRYGVPTALGVDYATVAAGVLAAQGVLAALFAGTRGRPVRRVSTSVAQAALLTVSQYLAAATADGCDGWSEPCAAGGPPFESADGVRYEIETFDATGWALFWAGLGAPEPAVHRGWRPFQHRYATATCPLPPELPAAARRASYPAAAAAARGAGNSIMPVRPDPSHLPDQPPCRVTPFPAPPPSPVLSPNSTPPGPTRRYTPVVSSSATPDGPAGGVGGRPGPLDGVVVVEAGRRLQGPLAGHVLGLLGATVIRIEPPGGDPMRGMPPMAGSCSARFLAINRGKLVVEVDLRSAAGRAEVHDLAARADVFLHNWAPGKARELRLDAPDLAASRPDLIYAWASGWGDAFGANPPLGTDFMVQAYSGLVTPRAEPAPSLMTLTDVLGGLVCAQGVLAALLARARTGGGQLVSSSLLSAATLLARSPRTARRPSPAATAEAPPDRCPLGIEPAVPVCTELRDLAADPRFAAALWHDGYTAVAPPWEFA